MSTLKKIMLGSALVAVAVTAFAAVKLTATRSNNFTWTSPTAAIPLNDGGATVIAWNEAAKGTRWLSYSAECSAEGGPSGWIDIDVIINGVAIKPTAGSSDGFCSPNNTTTSGDGWTRASITLAIPVKAGLNNVQILGRLDFVTGGWLGDSALVIN
jgi:hypothetical protein